MMPGREMMSVELAGGPLIVIGADPGPTTGACLALPGNSRVAYAYQCNAPAAGSLVASLIETARLLVAAMPGSRVLLAGERFVAGTGPGARGRSATVTRDVIEELTAIPGTSWHWRSAAEVKPWTTDKRLEKAGLLTECHGMPHALDACRHALFCAVHDGGLPDPLSREWGRKP